jgi:uncharacterized protein
LYNQQETYVKDYIMPLLTSPIDGSIMKQVHRFGIEIDVCPTSGGVWLDKGELEKLIHFLQESVKKEVAEQVAFQASPAYAQQPQQPAYGQASSHQGTISPKPYKKESTFDKIMEIFDFG